MSPGVRNIAPRTDSECGHCGSRRRFLRILTTIRLAIISSNPRLSGASPASVQGVGTILMRPRAGSVARNLEFVEGGGKQKAGGIHNQGRKDADPGFPSEDTGPGALKSCLARRSHPACATHRAPVILVGGTTEDAHLIVAPVRANVRPRKLVMAESFGDPG